MNSIRDTLEMLLDADLDVADRDEVVGYVRRSHELRSWLDSFDVRCVRRTSMLAEEGRSESADAMITNEGSQSSREGRQARQRAETCELFVLFERALSSGEIGAGHIDALSSAIRDLDAEQRFGLIDREEQLLVAARRLRVDDFARHARMQAADVVAQLVQAARTTANPGATNACSAESEPADGAVPGCASPSPSDLDPAVVEYERQRADSRVRRWRDAQTGMCMTLLALDPIRDAMFKKAYDRHLNAVRADGTAAGQSWQRRSGRRRAARHRPRGHPVHR